MNKHIIIMRHFETFKDKHGKEKIYYDDSNDKSVVFVNFIKDYINKHPDINKIKFYSSNHERTLMTSLIVSSCIKSEIINGNFKKINIDDPSINNIIDRDPSKKKHIKRCEIINQKINNKLKDDTLYIFITHSSVISNLFYCFVNMFAKKDFKTKSEKIHSYSLSYITKIDNKLTWDFNIKL
jgi:hypothetical protein